MNNKVIINPQLILKCNFKHIFTYRLLNHILTYYDNDSKRIFIDKQDIINRYNSNYRAVDNAMGELLNKKIIERYNFYKHQYSVSNKFLAGVIGESAD